MATDVEVWHWQMIARRQQRHSWTGHAGRLPLIRSAATRGDADGADPAYLKDRVRAGNVADSATVPNGWYGMGNNVFCHSTTPIRLANAVPAVGLPALSAEEHARAWPCQTAIKSAPGSI